MDSFTFMSTFQHNLFTKSKVGHIKQRINFILPKTAQKHK